MRRCLPRLALLILVPVLVGGRVTPQTCVAADESSPALIVQLVRQLGDESYRQRERATQQLVQIGVPAKDALLQGLKDPDREIRVRCQRVLSVVLEMDHLARLERFSAEKQGIADFGLPGWDRYRKLAGESPAARELFVEMQRAESAVLETATSSSEAASEFLQARSQNLYTELYQNGGIQQRQASLGTVAALFFVAAQGDVAVSDQTASFLYNFSYQAPFQQAISGGDKSEPLKRILGAWVSRTTGTNSAYTSLSVAMQYNLKEGLTPALSIVSKQGGNQVHVLQQALLVVAKFGDKQHVLEVEPLLENSDRLYQQTINGREVTAEVRDLALAVLVHLTGQSLPEYGLADVQKNSQTVFNYNGVSFKDDTARTAAIKKWRTWSAAHPTPAPSVPGS